MNKNRLKITSTKAAVRDILREALALTPGTHEKGNDDKSFLSIVLRNDPVKVGESLINFPVVFSARKTDLQNKDIFYFHRYFQNNIF